MDDLVKIALAGTNRVPFDARRDPRDAVRLVALANESEDAAGTLLLACGAEAIHRAAGYRPLRDVPALPAAPEDRPFASAAVAEAARAWFSVDELVDELRRADLLVPRELLPNVLAVEDPRMRTLLLPVLGHRGRWLASLDETMAWATCPEGPRDLSALRTVFDEGTIDERVAALAECRAADPAEGRRWLIEVFKTEKAENRQSLVESLATGVSLDDEDFLEASLRDRSQLVIAAAADLLRGLSCSKLLSRQLARAEEILVGGRDTRGDMHLRTRLPEEISADWKRDLGSPLVLPEKSPKWAAIVAVLSAPAPTHWETKFAASPEELIQAASTDHFGDAVILAWATPEALRRLAEADRRRWWKALFDHASELEGVGEKRNVRDSTVLQQLARTLEDANLPAWLELPQHLPARSLPPWFAMTRERLAAIRDARVVPAIVATLRNRVISAGDARIQWAGLLEPLARLVRLEDMPDVLVPWTLPEEGSWQTRHVAERVEAFLETVRRRRRLIELIRAEATNCVG